MLPQFVLMHSAVVVAWSLSFFPQVLNQLVILLSDIVVTWPLSLSQKALVPSAILFSLTVSTCPPSRFLQREPLLAGSNSFIKRPQIVPFMFPPNLSAHISRLLVGAHMRVEFKLFRRGDINDCIPNQIIAKLE